MPRKERHTWRVSGTIVQRVLLCPAGAMATCEVLGIKFSTTAVKGSVADACKFLLQITFLHATMSFSGMLLGSKVKMVSRKAVRKDFVGRKSLRSDEAESFQADR
jgi:hypothetical protein